MLQCQGVTFTLPGGRRLLEKLSFTLSTGELCVVLGHNGSGKSTLCRLLAGLYLPASGTVSIDGYETADPACAAHWRPLIQFVAHNPEAQVIGETVAEDITFGLANFGVAGPDVQARLSWVLGLFEIEELRDRRVDSLSRGQLQRVRLAGAVAVRPQYLVLDESIAMLDLPTRERVLGSLRQLQREYPLGILLTTHELRDLAWADRVCWLDGGQMRFDLPAPLALEALADHSAPPFDLPALARTAAHLRSAGWTIPLHLRVGPFVNALCE